MRCWSCVGFFSFVFFPPIGLKKHFDDILMLTAGDSFLSDQTSSQKNSNRPKIAPISCVLEVGEKWCGIMGSFHRGELVR